MNETDDKIVNKRRRSGRKIKIWIIDQFKLAYFGVHTHIRSHSSNIARPVGPARWSTLFQLCIYRTKRCVYLTESSHSHVSAMSTRAVFSVTLRYVSRDAWPISICPMSNYCVHILWARLVPASQRFRPMSGHTMCVSVCVILCIFSLCIFFFSFCVSSRHR